MKRNGVLKVFLVVATLVVCGFAWSDERYNSVIFGDVSPLKVNGEEGVSGAFAGVSDGVVLVAGGCNFPDVKAKDGGKKVFYDKVFALEDGAWKEVGTLPAAVAYGVSVTTPEGVVCIGGKNDEGSMAKVLLLSYEKKNLTIKELPSLDWGLDNAIGAFDGEYIYVAGGESNRAKCKYFSRIRLRSLQKGWEPLPEFPGEMRVQAASVVQSNAYGNDFYLIGGYAPGDENTPYVLHRSMLRFDIKHHKWEEECELPTAIIGATAVPSGNSHILVIGGVNEEVFEEAVNRPQEGYLCHEREWYRFNDTLRSYNTITRAWGELITDSRLAKAGAMALNYNGGIVVIDGESQPGVRSDEVTTLSFESTKHFGWVNWSVLILYLVAMLLLGYYFMKKEKGGDDFFKGGGRIPWWAAGISIYATMLSAITYMAYPAKAYATNWTYYIMLITILLVSFPVVKYYLPFFRRLNVTSAYEYLECRFNGVLRLMASTLFIVFMVARMALVLYLPSLALTAVTGIDIYTCILLMGVITIIYCTMGGVEAVIWGDVIQGFILVGGAIFAVFYLIFSTEGGWNGFVDIAMADEKLKLVDWSLDLTQATFWVVVIGGIANNLISYTSDQTVIQRYLTTKDEKSARDSIFMNGLMSVFVSIAFFAIGAGLYTFFKTHPTELDVTMSKTDAIFPFFMMSQLPAGVAGLLIAAIFAATMSTISANINSISTAFSVDFYKRWAPQTSDARLLKVARWACIVSGVLGMGLAILMATWDIYSLLDFFQEILGLLSSGLGGLFIMGIFFPRINGKVALTGFLCGIAAVFCIKYFTDLHFLLYGFVGMVVSVGVALILSLIFPNRQSTEGLTWESLKKKNI